MNKDKTTQNNILKAWQTNATAWMKTLDNNEISSRKLFTNQAIVDAVLAIAPKTVLDAGCGEGWLARVLHQHHIEANGFDGVEALIESARKNGSGQYFVLNYDDIRNGQGGAMGLYEAIVFNYALFEKEKANGLLSNLKENLLPNGHLIIQTISDQNELFANRSEDGWMTEDWKTLQTNYSSPFQWYYRSALEWQELFNQTGFACLEQKEIIHPLTAQAFSVIYTLKKVSKE